MTFPDSWKPFATTRAPISRSNGSHSTCRALYEGIETPIRILGSCFEGEAPFSNETLGKLEELKNVCGLDLTAADSHKLDEGNEQARASKG